MTIQTYATPAPILLQAGEGKQIKLKNVTVTHKALGMDTGNAWGLLEYEAPAAFAGPPLHWHATLEAFYIVEGVLTFWLGEQVFKAQPGAFVLVPPGALHKFANQTALPARFLVLISPSDFEHYFAELAELVNEAPDWPPTDPNTLIMLGALEQKYGIYH